MNRTLKAMATLMLMMVFAAGCNKPDEPNNSGNNDVDVTTFEPHDITINSAIGGGKVVSVDGNFILMKGICWSKHPQPTTDDFYSENGTGAGNFNVEMTNLFMDSVYYFRAYAVTPNGTTYGNQIAFSTKNGVPVVNTAEITDITVNSAIGGGIVVDDGGVYSTCHGICWSTNPSPTIDDGHTSDGMGVGSFSSSLRRLENNMIYYVRAYAINDYSTVYGDEISFTTADGIPEVKTSAITNVSTWSAIGGGTVISNGGESSTVCGLCWSTSHGPVIEGPHSSIGIVMGDFVSAITNLTENTTYYVRAYASNDYYTAYGDEISFTTLGNEYGDYEYVDLGLPSGTLWATCNVGANSPEELGNLYAWGETETKDVYEWNTYKYCIGDEHRLTKYCCNPEYGYNGFIDNLTVLQASDDAATMVFGIDWRTPTQAEWEELYRTTGYAFTSQNGVEGMLFTGMNGQRLFIPTSFDAGDDMHYGLYWTSTLDIDCSSRAFSFDIYYINSPGTLFIDCYSSYDRCKNRLVRPVRLAK